MKKKSEKTVSINQEPEGSSEYEGQPIYLNIQGNAWKENALYITTCIYQAQQHKAKLYIGIQSGGPNKPPDCPPGFPNC